MPFNHTLTKRVTTGSETITKTTTQQAGLEANLSEVIPDNTSAGEVSYTLDQSACVSFFMVADQDLTVETNNSGSPDDSFELEAGKPYMWSADSLEPFLVTQDITALFVTNASGSSATLDIRALVDPTP